MSKGFTLQQSIQCSVAEVWQYLADFSNADQWMDEVNNLVPIESGEIGRGSRLQIECNTQTRESMVSYWQPNKSFAITSDLGIVKTTHTYRLASINGKLGPTNLQLSVDCVCTGLWKFFSPLVIWARKRIDSRQLANVKAILETAPTREEIDSFGNLKHLEKSDLQQ